jgi:hypothetical protein
MTDTPLMSFRFRRSVSILPGIRLNFGKRGISTSIGVRGAHVTFGPTGTRTTVGLPGTGLSYTHVEKSHHRGARGAVVAATRPAAAQGSPGATPGSALPAQASHGQAFIIVIVIVVVIAIGRWAGSAQPARNGPAPSPTPLAQSAERARDDRTEEINSAARGAAQLRRSIANARSLELTRVTLMPSGVVCYQLKLTNSRGVPYSRTAVMDGALLRVSGTRDFDPLWNRRCGSQGRDITADLAEPRSRREAR